MKAQKKSRKNTVKEACVTMLASHVEGLRNYKKLEKKRIHPLQKNKWGIENYMDP
jgi:hypothetical protein